jgi:hypothetical protein
MKWTDDEINYLRNNLDKSSNDISIILKRNRKSILRKLKSLGLISEYRIKNRFIGKYDDIEKEKIRRKKISETCRSNKKSGGLRKGSGRGRKGTYKGFWCDSSYELAWVIFHLDHKIEFTRNTKKFKYLYKDVEEKNYIPDFIKNGIYYEIKGYANDTLEWKKKYFPYELEVVFEKDMYYIFDYVYDKYGKNFISLYEDRIYRGCKICNGYIYKKNKSGTCKNCLRKTDIVKKDKKKNKFCHCGNLISTRNKMCKKCSSFNRRKVNRPNLIDLVKEIDEFGYTGVGKKYGVSDNCIRKWIKNLEVYPMMAKGSHC